MKKILLFLILILVLGAGVGGYYYYKNFYSIKLEVTDVLPAGALYYSRAVDVETNLEKFRNSSFFQKMSKLNAVDVLKQNGVQIGRASCRERVCQYV